MARGVILAKRAEHCPLAAAHLPEALAEVGTIQQCRIAETAPHLIEQVPVLTECPQIANDMADHVHTLHVKQQTGDSLSDGERALRSPCPHGLLAQAKQPGRDDGTDRALIRERCIGYL